MPKEEKDKISPLLQKLKKEKKIANNFQKRRHDDWNSNYELYRGEVKTNRLTQRQPVNIPIMKESIKTLLSKINTTPDITFKELSGNKQKEMIINERWKYDFDRLDFEGIDIQDKKTVLLYGRSFKKLNFYDGEFDIDALDIYDVVVDPKVNPLDIETARWVIHQNIYKPLKAILNDDRYSKKGKKELENYAYSEEGQEVSQNNRQEMDNKQERLKAVGVNEDQDFAGADTIVNLAEHYTKVWNKEKKEYEKRLIVVADDRVIIRNETLEDVIGVDFYPFVTWGDDIETQDFWSDAPADLIRVPNKVLNIWFSQLLENRTLRNFGMHWFDATIPDYEPPTVTPEQGKMIPSPGDPRRAIQQVDIPQLQGTIPEMDFITNIIERASAATAIQKGVSERQDITLGEVKILAGKAASRINSMAKFYRKSWKKLAEKWYKILEANEIEGKKTLYKTSSKGKVWPKEITKDDWKSKAGYEVKVASANEAEADELNAVKKLMAVQQQYPENKALREILQRKMLEATNLSGEEIRRVIEEEKQKTEGREIMPGMMDQEQQQQPQPNPQLNRKGPPTPPSPEEGGNIQESIKNMMQNA